MIRPAVLSNDAKLVWSAGTGNQAWAMFCAAIEGDLEAIRRMVGSDPSLVRCAYSCKQPLHFAVRENRVAVAEYLLEPGADPLCGSWMDSLFDIARDRGHDRMYELLTGHMARRYGVAPGAEAVAAAIRARDLPRVRALLDAEAALLHAADERTSQPIHRAVMSRQPELVDELLARGANLEAQRADGARPLQLTNGDYHCRGWRDVPGDFEPGPEEVLAHLLARGAYLDICTAAALGDARRVRELLDGDPGLADRGVDHVTYYVGSGTPLRNAAARGHIEIVRLLLERGADPNRAEEGIAPHGHALYSAVAQGHIEIARLLLAHGANPDAAVESSADCLTRAIMRDDTALIELLASHGAAQSLEILSYYGDVKTVAAVLRANPALADDTEALGAAATEGQEAVVRLLLEYRPDLARRVGCAGKTPAITALLFEHGMDPSHRDWLLITPLHRFARGGQLEQATLFLDRGADLSARDEDLCSTPLGYAAKAGKREMVELLLARGAPVNVADDPPWATPLAWATRRGHVEVAEVLRCAGAKS